MWEENRRQIGSQNVKRNNGHIINRQPDGHLCREMNFNNFNFVNFVFEMHSHTGRHTPASYIDTHTTDTYVNTPRHIIPENKPTHTDMHNIHMHTI